MMYREYTAKTFLGICMILYFLTNITASKAPGVVVTNGYDCATIGADILKKGGTAVDGALAALFCEGLKLPQSTGLGGGFLMTVYDAKTKKAATINAREVAPLSASMDMYNGTPEKSESGPLSVAVPGELRGYKIAYEKYGGGVKWEEIVQPSINLLEKGIEVTPFFENVLNTHQEIVLNDPGLRSVFIDPETKKTYRAGERFKNPKLLETLKIIAKNGGDTLHNGPLTKIFIDEIREIKGNITEKDMNQYQVKIEDPLKIRLANNKTLYTAPLPGSGVILGYIMNTLKDFITKDDDRNNQTWQKVVESFKYGYGKRTLMGDPFGENAKKIEDLVSSLISEELAVKTRNNINDNINVTFVDPTHYGAQYGPVKDHGTAHICVLAENGDAVSVTSTINLIFGSGILLQNTGIILNDEMGDFSAPGFNNDDNLPPSEANYISPGKRPLSSMVPSLIVDENGDIEMVVGGAGGSKITTAVALTILKYMTFEYDLFKAVNDKRLHHQLFPMLLQLEEDYCKPDGIQIRDYLCDNIKHNCTCTITDGFSAVTAIAKKGIRVYAVTDKRRQGEYVYTSSQSRMKSEVLTTISFIFVLISVLYK